MTFNDNDSDIIVIDDRKEGSNGLRLVLDLSLGWANARLGEQRLPYSDQFLRPFVRVSEAELDRALQHVRRAKLKDQATLDIERSLILNLSPEERIQAALLEKARQLTQDLLNALAMDPPIPGIVRSLITLLAPLGNMLDREGAAAGFAKRLDVKARREAGLCIHSKCSNEATCENLCPRHDMEEDAKKAEVDALLDRIEGSNRGLWSS